MKTKIILLALAIMSSSLVFSQTVQHESKTDCEQKVLKKIKSKMNYLHVKDYLVEGEKNSVIITCYVNEDKQVEVAKIDGYDEELNQAVIETLEKRPVKCENAESGEYFTFKLTFYHRPA
jgi:uncharacterized secreted protein with C-terminal beta-propeller domain